MARERAGRLLSARLGEGVPSCLHQERLPLSCTDGRILRLPPITYLPVAQDRSALLSLRDRLQLMLTSQPEADRGPEYVIEGFGSYLRVDRDPDTECPVALAERAMLDVCASTFAELAAQHEAKITEPPPPRYRGALLRRRGVLH